MAKDLENYISGAIEGCLNQETTFAYELILSDDASSDNTLAVCERYRALHPSKVRILASSTRLGLEENFIKTLKACSGKYVAFCDGDDYWTDRLKLQKQVSYLEANPGCSLICSDYDYVDQRGSFEISTWKYEHYGKTFSLYEELDESIATTLTVVVRRAALDPLLEQLTQETHPFIWDTVLWAYCLSRGWGFFYPEKMAIRRVLATGDYTAKTLIFQLDIEKKCLLSLRTLLPQDKTQKFLAQKLYANAVNTWRALLEQGERPEATKVLLKNLASMGWARSPRFKTKFLYYLGRTYI